MVTPGAGAELALMPAFTDLKTTLDGRDVDTPLTT
jgi:hypothetical protein